MDGLSFTVAMAVSDIVEVLPDASYDFDKWRDWLV
jgi:hypothetical protein